jgi:hypothetical protein
MNVPVLPILAGVMYSIECDDCGEQVVAPRNSIDAPSGEVVVVCVDCKTEWVFIYDDKGECVGCRRARPWRTGAADGFGADSAAP